MHAPEGGEQDVGAQGQRWQPGDARSKIAQVAELLKQEQDLCKQAHAAALNAVNVANEALRDAGKAKSRIDRLQQNLNELKQELMGEKDSNSIDEIATLAQAVKKSCEKDIAAYCEAATVEELTSSCELDETLHMDVDIIIEDTLDKMGALPTTVRKDVRASLHEFAEKEIMAALHVNSERIAMHLSKAVDASVKILKEECVLFETTKFPMKKTLLRQQFTAMLKRELERIQALSMGLQGKCGVDVECGRLRQKASILFDELEVANNRAVQHSVDALTQVVLTVIYLQREVIALCTRVMQEVEQKAGTVSELEVFDFRSELNQHRDQLTDEMNRRYVIEMRQMLNEVAYAAREELGRQVMYQLDGKLPMVEEEIKIGIDSAVAHVKGVVTERLAGWTLLGSDLEAKHMELEELGKEFTDKYLHRNQQLEKEESLGAVNTSTEQREIRHNEATDLFERSPQEVGRFTTDDNIDSMFQQALQELATRFLVSGSNGGIARANEQDTLPTYRPNFDVDGQTMLKRFTPEKEKEKRMHERERLAAERMEAETNRLKRVIARSIFTRKIAAPRKWTSCKRRRRKLLVIGSREKKR